MTVRSELMPIIKKNQENKETNEAYQGLYNTTNNDTIDNRNAMNSD